MNALAAIIFGLVLWLTAPLVGLWLLRRHARPHDRAQPDDVPAGEVSEGLGCFHSGVDT